MKKLLFSTGAFCLFTLISNAQNNSNENCKLEAKSYKVRVKKSFSQNQNLVESIIPRSLKKSEYCLITENRHASKTVVLSLDERHEVIIYPSQNK